MHRALRDQRASRPRQRQRVSRSRRTMLGARLPELTSFARDRREGSLRVATMSAQAPRFDDSLDAELVRRDAQ
jgi:hypothetical protein